MTDELPLPEPVNFSDVQLPGNDEFNRRYAVYGYTADQMRERDAMWAERLAAAVAREREKIMAELRQALQDDSNVAAVVVVNPDSRRPATP